MIVTNAGNTTRHVTRNVPKKYKKIQFIRLTG